MPQDKYVPKHRGAPDTPVRSGLRNVAVLSGVAVVATGATVGSGVALAGGDTSGTAVAISAATPAEKLTAEDLAERVQRASRSSADRTAGVDADKVAALSNEAGVAKAGVKDLSKADPKTLARALLPQFGFSSDQFGCLESLWNKESGWNPRADNPTSSAYGIPQALPGSKMASAGSDWEYNPETQIRWGLGYIQARYGSPCSAWGHSQARNWY